MTLWPTVPLGEACCVGAGNSAPQSKNLFDDGKYPFIRTADVGRVKFGEISTARDLLNDKGTKGLRLVPKNTVLMPKSGASTYLNHRVLTTREAYVASHLATLVAHPEKLLPRYLLYIMSRIKAQDLLQDQNYPSLNLSLIREIQIPLPPLDEQERIVAMLDAAFDVVEGARAELSAALQDCDTLFQSTLTRSFAPDGMNGWPSVSLGRVCDLKNGFAFKSRLFKETGTPVVRIGDIKNGRIEFGGMVFADNADYAEDLSKYLISPGELLIAMSGATTGKVGINSTNVHFFQNQRVGRLVPHEGLNKNYLHNFMKTKVDENLSISTGSAQPNLSTKQILATQIPLPPLDEQKRIVEKLDALRQETDALSQRLTAQLADLDELKQSLLSAAFNGELPTLAVAE